jgi:hypothetical protein
MTSINLKFLTIFFLSLTSCAALETTDEQSNLRRSTNSNHIEQSNSPNQFGWNSSNCAHIKADGHCAHPLAPNLLDSSSSPTMTAPNSNGWNSTNCAHITADGNCAHPL